ncbi:hypothetical protein GCM10011492_11340 [Flexivirga endophytica]|uniref:Uncharacterized protein n=1 Tax=Flexivirga endophytica TaxID=1849103 RepID=A0A916SZA7_9MICO|nr:hypothetical protein [Flexivirga endophytica]GGB23220.1 hypothetical protein GCM10011492_11340 [Flexivirga endophytica]GHB57135.1 hypothetical protein GCM10008112_27880 [Flexivirga endophytica]
MTKQQRLRNTAEGLMAGLVANGFRGPFRYSHLDWELPFYRAWARWAPPQRNPSTFPAFEIGGHGRTSQARELLWQLKRTSPFHEYNRELLPVAPRGLTPEEYLEIWVTDALPQEWIALAARFLAELKPDEA